MTKLYSEHITNKRKEEYNLLEVESVEFDKDVELTRDAVFHCIKKEKSK